MLFEAGKTYEMSVGEYVYRYEVLSRTASSVKLATCRRNEIITCRISKSMTACVGHEAVFPCGSKSGLLLTADAVSSAAGAGYRMICFAGE